MTSGDVIVLGASLAALGILVALVHFLPHRYTQRFLPVGASNDGMSRVSTLDGLRAFLALGVVIAHSWGFRDQFFAGNWWGRPENPYIFHAANLSVATFFMITGFLFWTKAILRRGRIPAARLYVNRARRILPLYYVLCGGAILVALVAPREGGVEAARKFPGEVASLLVPGWRTTGPLLGTDRLYLLGQASTLLYELGFYLVLPAVAFAARSRKVALGFILAGFAILLAKGRVTGNYDYPYLSFLSGLATAEIIVQAPGWCERLRSPLWSGVILIAWLLLPLSSGGMITPVALAFTGMAFLVFAAGNDLFGLLALRGARVLGTISYSIYLMHMLVLYPLLCGLDRFTSVERMNPLVYTGVVFGLTIAVVALSLFTYARIEAPWLRPRAAPAKAA